MTRGRLSAVGDAIAQRRGYESARDIEDVELRRQVMADAIAALAAVQEFDSKDMTWMKEWAVALQAHERLVRAQVAEEIAKDASKEDVTRTPAAGAFSGVVRRIAANVIDRAPRI